MRVGLLSLAPVDAIILASRVKEIGCFTLSASFLKRVCEVRTGSLFCCERRCRRDKSFDIHY